MLDMGNPFFNQPVLDSPYEYPSRHWELSDSGQPTHRILDARRRVSFISPIPKPRKRRGAAGEQAHLMFDEASRELADGGQQYDLTAIINEVRRRVDAWRNLPDPAQWRVTPETARLLQHWRPHRFSGIRPFFCQVEAVETAIWLTKVAPHAGRASGDFLDHLNNLRAYGRWAFAKFTEVYAIQSDFEDRIEREFNCSMNQFRIGRDRGRRMTGQGGG